MASTFDALLCANCDSWREEHYNPDGSWRGEEIECSEYQGVRPDSDRFKQRDAQLAAFARELEKEEKERIAG